MTPINAPLEYDTIDGVLAPSQTQVFYGHKTILSSVEQMREEGKLHHALLLEGDKGVGKATFAFRLIWNILTEQKGALKDPDHTSLDWRLIVQKSHPRVIHVSRPYDAKTERFRSMITVDEIRNVMHFLAQTSSDGGWRIVLVDSADDMNRNASNALLKTLEEPPSKVLFILISHYAGRLLPTIRSRCQSHIFHPLQDEDLEEALKEATNSSFTPASADASYIIKNAEGSVRQAALLINYGGLEITRSVDEILKSASIDTQKVHQLAQVLSARDATIQYQHFCDNYLHRIATLAKMKALENKQEQSSFYAKMWQNISIEMSEANSYNLDKKQFIITLINRLHKALYP